MLKVYYKYYVSSYKEAEWVRLRDKFFTHFLPHKEEALGIKERCPMDYMPYIEEQFWRATGLCLNGLRFYSMDKARELLSQIGGSTRPPP